MADRITDALRGPYPPIVPQPESNQPLDKEQGEAGSGTAQSGYVTPDLGPFECANCIHFDGQSKCNHPEVISDPEVQGNVEAEACCNFFKSAGSESQEEEHNEGGGEA